VRTPTAPESAENVIIRLFERRNQALNLRQLHDLGDVGDSLLRWGALQQDETLTSVGCRSCGEDHLVELEFDPASGSWRYYCGSVGFVAVDADDLITLRLDPSWLVARLSESLQIRRPRQRELIASTLWDLGEADLGGATPGGRLWTAFLTRAVSTALDAVVDALHTWGRKLPGFVLTSSTEAPWHLSLPHGYRFVPLSDVLEVRARTLEVALDALMPLLRRRSGRHAFKWPTGPEPEPGSGFSPLGVTRRAEDVMRARSTRPTLAAPDSLVAPSALRS
jgi:hypothetical protein